MKALNIFNSLANPDTISYNSMSNKILFYLNFIFISIELFSFEVNAFGLNGMASQAIQLYKQMPANLRDEISHGSVLNACSHAGFLREARTIFNDIPIKTMPIITTMVQQILFNIL